MANVFELLLEAANEIRNNELPSSNTAMLVGQHLIDIVTQLQSIDSSKLSSTAFDTEVLKLNSALSKKLATAVFDTHKVAFDSVSLTAITGEKRNRGARGRQQRRRKEKEKLF